MASVGIVNSSMNSMIVSSLFYALVEMCNDGGAFICLPGNMYTHVKCIRRWTVVNTLKLPIYTKHIIKYFAYGIKRMKKEKILTRC